MQHLTRTQLQCLRALVRHGNAADSELPLNELASFAKLDLPAVQNDMKLLAQGGLVQLKGPIEQRRATATRDGRQIVLERRLRRRLATLGRSVATVVIGGLGVGLGVWLVERALT